jgi:hypothetical protein
MLKCISEDYEATIFRAKKCGAKFTLKVENTFPETSVIV